MYVIQWANITTDRGALLIWRDSQSLQTVVQLVSSPVGPYVYKIPLKTYSPTSVYRLTGKLASTFGVGMLGFATA